MSASKTGKRKNRVFLVDDHPLVREWLTNLINQQPDLEVCGEAENAAEALRGISAAKPVLAIIDISLNAASGLELVKDICIQYPLVAPLVLSMHEEELYAERAMRAGISSAGGDARDQQKHSHRNPESARRWDLRQRKGFKCDGAEIS